MHGILVLEGIQKNKQEWLSLRQKGVTASEIAVVCGLSSYKTELELWAEKTEKVQPQVLSSPLLEFGILNEPFVRSLTAEQLSKELLAVDALYQHPELGWALASPDCWLIENSNISATVELKTATSKSAHLWDDDQCPESYQCQLQWQLGVCGLPYGYLSCMIGGDPRDIRCVRFDADSDAFAYMVECGMSFMESVQKDIPPNPSGGDSKLVSEIISRRKKEVSVSLEGQLADEVANFIVELRSAKAEKKILDEQCRSLKDSCSQIENKIKLILGNAECAVLPDGRKLSLKTVTVQPHMVDAYSYVRLTLPR